MTNSAIYDYRTATKIGETDVDPTDMAKRLAKSTRRNVLVSDVTRGMSYIVTRDGQRRETNWDRG
jgi:hypothetical protein